MACLKQFIWLSCILLAISLFSLPSLATSPCDSVVGRPCIALVLGGGGARGGAHLGVIRQLEEQHIPIDMVIGTSIGAFIGGLYASGHSPDEIAKILERLDWGSGFRDKVNRDEMPMRRKLQQDSYPMRLELGLGSDGLKLPKGLLLGQAMAELVDEAFGVQPDLGHFDQLNIPFRAVATDLTNREAVVLMQGSLVAAIQASMSIPGVVRPAKLDGRLLVDGGVANNLPIDIAKQLGADRVIAVDIGLPAKTAEQLDSAFAITEQLTGFLVRDGLTKQIALLEPDDIFFQPELSDIGTLNFAMLAQATTKGQAAAVVKKNQLAALSIDPFFYDQWQRMQRQVIPKLLTIDSIVLENHSRLSDQLLLDRLGAEPGQTYSSEHISKGIRQIYGLDTFERVSHQLLVNEQKQTALLINAEEKNWGPGYLNFRFNLDDDFNTNQHVQLAASYTYTNLSPLGAEWYSEVAVGTDKLFSTELYWPVFSAETFVSAQVQHHSESLIIEDQTGASTGDFFREEQLFNIDLGWNISDQWVATFGWTAKNGQYLLPAVLKEIYNANALGFTRHGPTFSLILDSLNDNNFPSRGMQIKANWQWLQDDFLGLGSHSDNRSLSAIIARQWQQHLLKAHWRYDTYQSEGGDIALEQYSLGGLFNLSGYPKNYLFGPDVRFASLIYMYKLHENKFSMFNSPLYLGSSLERGRVKDNIWQNAEQPSEWIWAGSVFLGWDSVIGPIYLGYGQAESLYRDKAYQFYLSIGQPY